MALNVTFVYVVGSIGCDGDVKHILNEACQGKNTCNVIVPSKELLEASNCPKDLAQYLAVSYDCFKGDSMGRKHTYMRGTELLFVSSSLWEKLLLV